MNLEVIRGPNFSGRTKRLRAWAGLPEDHESEVAYDGSAYVGPDASSALSGIASTVEAELELMAADRAAAAAARFVMEDLGFGRCLRQHPFTLSGGEQSILAIIAAVAGRPKRLAIDCALEQLSPETRTRLIAHLDSVDVEIMLADNRLDEWYEGPVDLMSAPEDSPAILIDTPLPFPQEQCNIELIDVCHSYVKGRPILHNINIRIDAAERYLLKGPNGSGKSTLSRILCGLLKPTSGEIKINGKTVHPWKFPGRNVSYHFQNPDLQIFESSVRKQLGQTEATEVILECFGLGQVRNSHPLDLPFVMRKRLAIASALGRNTGFVILDEPTLGQDDKSAITGHSAILNGRSNLIISHSKKFENLPVIQLQGGN
jgi:energy-coupling factor transport system ATP-binding protein